MLKNKYFFLWWTELVTWTSCFTRQPTEIVTWLRPMRTLFYFCGKLGRCNVKPDVPEHLDRARVTQRYLTVPSVVSHVRNPPENRGRRSPEDNEEVCLPPDICSWAAGAPRTLCPRSVPQAPWQQHLPDDGLCSSWRHNHENTEWCSSTHFYKRRKSPNIYEQRLLIN